MHLAEIIKEKIEMEGPVSFHDFMEMALYYPDLGYYTSQKERIGAQGDYYTSPYLTSIFGHLIAKQVEEMWSILGKKQFTIVEFGAGSGSLCNDILSQLKLNTRFYENLDYYVIEKDSRLKEKIIPTEKVKWVDDIDEVPLHDGCILSNELVDNFPVHKVEMQDELMEVFVDYKNGFIETLRPANEILKNYFEELQVELPQGYCTEINLQAIDWISSVVGKLRTGFVITIDYGFSSSELYSNKRSSGNIVCYHKHKVNFSPYENIGEQDITTHINFSALIHWGQKNDLHYTGFTTQANFLLALGLTDYLRKMEQSTSDSFTSVSEKAFMIRTFLMDMGNKLKVLIQHKGIEKPNLSGLQFSQHLD